MKNKILLSNGCSSSTLSVNPKTWKTAKKLDLKKDQYILYYFYDPNYEKPKQVIIKGMNEYKSLDDRRAATKRILENELNQLKELG